MGLHKYKIGIGFTALMLLMMACALPLGTSTPQPTAVENTKVVPSATVPVVVTATTAPSATTAPTASIVPPSATVAPTAQPTMTPVPASPTPAPPTKTTGTPVNILDLHMVDPQVGWAIGTYQDNIADVLRTTDGGNSWKVVTPHEQDRKNLKAVAFFLDMNNAWVTYAGDPGSSATKGARIWHTTNAGAAWKESDIDGSSLTAEFFVPGQIGFSNPSNGWLIAHLGAGMMHDYVVIYTTTDGGATWSDMTDPNLGNLPMSCYKNDLWFRDASHGYLAGTCAGVQAGLYFYQSSNAGATWDLVKLPAPAGSPDIFTKENVNNEAEGLTFSSANQGWVMVTSTDLNNLNNPKRWLYRTADGGKTWTSQLLPGPWGMISVLDANSVWYLARKTKDSYVGSIVYHSADGGKTWKGLDTVNWQGLIQFVDAKTGWVIAQAGTSTALVRSQNGGTSWDLIKTVLVP